MARRLLGLLPALLDGPADLGRYGFDPLDYADPLLRTIFAATTRPGLLSTTSASIIFVLAKPDGCSSRRHRLASPNRKTVKDCQEQPTQCSFPSDSLAYRRRVAAAIRQTGDPAIVVSNPVGLGRAILVALAGFICLG